ncbi:unnamed protein product, partial [Symbiodinium microadriaticum]
MTAERALAQCWYDEGKSPSTIAELLDRAQVDDLERKLDQIIVKAEGQKMIALKAIDYFPAQNTTMALSSLATNRRLRFFVGTNFSPAKFAARPPKAPTVPGVTFKKLFAGQYLRVQFQQAYHDGNRDFRWTRGAAMTAFLEGLWDVAKPVAPEDVRHMQSRLVVQYDAHVTVERHPVTIQLGDHRKCSTVPSKMKTSELHHADIFFDFRFVLMRPFACAEPVSLFAPDCQNKETNSPDLVVNQLRLSVQEDSWADYAECNLGISGDVDPFGNPCPAGKYCCFCGRPYARQTEPCNGTVGRLQVKKGMDYVPHSWCNKSAPEWVCWQTKLNAKLPASNPGWWYSTLAQGYCPRQTGTNCAWNVSSVQKIVNKTCHK